MIRSKVSIPKEKKYDITLDNKTSATMQKHHALKHRIWCRYQPMVYSIINQQHPTYHITSRILTIYRQNSSNFGNIANNIIRSMSHGIPQTDMIFTIYWYWLITFSVNGGIIP